MPLAHHIRDEHKTSSQPRQEMCEVVYTAFGSLQIRTTCSGLGVRYSPLSPRIRLSSRRLWMTRVFLNMSIDWISKSSRDERRAVLLTEAPLPRFHQSPEGLTDPRHLYILLMFAGIRKTQRCRAQQACTMGASKLCRSPLSVPWSCISRSPSTQCVPLIPTHSDAFTQAQAKAQTEAQAP